MIDKSASPTNGASDVAMWHILSGLPDNVTDEGEIVHINEAWRQRNDKELLRSAIANLVNCDSPDCVRRLAWLAARYFDGGDFEAARAFAHVAQDRPPKPVHEC